MKYPCPVCGFPDLEEKPTNHEICPSCGTQFGYDDFLRSHEVLRQNWLSSGANFFLKGFEPYGWNPYNQLQNAGFFGIDNTSKTKTTLGVPNSNWKRFEVVSFNYGEVKIVSNLLDIENCGEEVGRLATV